MEQIVTKSEHIDAHGIDLIIGAWNVALLTTVKNTVPVKKERFYMFELIPERDFAGDDLAWYYYRVSCIQTKVID